MNQSLRKTWISAALAILAVMAVALGAEKAKDAEEGWRSLFDGKTLDGWEVKSGFATYRVEDGAIVGKTAEGSGNTFLCTKEQFGDFELTVEVKLDDEGLNSGIQVRSQVREGSYGGRVHGPQVEIAAGPGLSGFIYGEGLKGWMSPELKGENKGANKTSHVKNGEWNQYRVLAVGPRIQTWINGHLVAELNDKEVYKTYAKGLIGLQVHGVSKEKGVMQVRWRNIKIRPIESK